MSKYGMRGAEEEEEGFLRLLSSSDDEGRIVIVNDTPLGLGPPL